MASLNLFSILALMASLPVVLPLPGPSPTPTPTPATLAITTAAAFHETYPFSSETVSSTPSVQARHGTERRKRPVVEIVDRAVEDHDDTVTIPTLVGAAPTAKAKADAIRRTEKTPVTPFATTSPAAATSSPPAPAKRHAEGHVKFEWATGPMHVTGTVNTYTLDATLHVFIPSFYMHVGQGRLEDGIEIDIDEMHDVLSRGKLRFYGVNGDELWAGGVFHYAHETVIDGSVKVFEW